MKYYAYFIISFNQISFVIFHFIRWWILQLLNCNNSGQRNSFKQELNLYPLLWKFVIYDYNAVTIKYLKNIYFCYFLPWAWNLSDMTRNYNLYFITYAEYEKNYSHMLLRVTVSNVEYKWLCLSI